MEIVRNCLQLEFIKRHDYKKVIKQQSKLTFNGIHKSYEICDSYVFKKNEVVMDKPIYLGFTVLELSKLHMYETLYDILQPYFGMEIIQLHYMDTDSFILSVNAKDLIKDLKNLENIFDFSSLKKLSSNKNKKVIGKFKKAINKNVIIDEFVCLRSKKYSFKCGDDSEKKLKDISKSQSKPNKFEEYTIVYLVDNTKKSVIIILFDQLTMKCIFKKSKHLHYSYLMISDVTKMKLKVNHGSNHICCFISR